MNESPKPSFKDSLKSWDTENIIDRHFYRPIGYQLALLLSKTKITPNAVTIFSIFVGIAACGLFYPHNLWWNSLGLALLIFANILDCVDGQLARLTGIKSKLGRILDGFCGDLWFLTFYTVITLRLIQMEGWDWWVILIALTSAASHLKQAGMVDYYKTLHLHMLKSGKNSEFESSESIRAKYHSLTWKKDFVEKIFLRMYSWYTKVQELSTPRLHALMVKLDSKYPEGYPEEVVVAFRQKSLKLMPLLDTMTFNFRSIVMVISVFFNVVWLYFLVEILILNPMLIIATIRHEKMCRELQEN